MYKYKDKKFNIMSEDESSAMLDDAIEQFKAARATRPKEEKILDDNSKFTEVCKIINQEAYFADCSINAKIERPPSTFGCIRIITKSFDISSKCLLDILDLTPSFEVCANTDGSIDISLNFFNLNTKKGVI